jgi:hypothetical protein
MKYIKLIELFKEKTNTPDYYFKSFQVMTSNQDEALIFLDEEFCFLKSKGRKDFETKEYKYSDVKEFNENPGVFKVYNYVITFRDDTELKLTASQFKENTVIEEEFKKRLAVYSESMLDENGKIVAVYDKSYKKRRRYLLGSADIAGWTYREDAFNGVKELQFQEKKDGSLEQATIEAERDNEFDNKAIKVLVSGRHIGYIPKHSSFKEKLNKLIDKGYQNKIQGYVNYEYDPEEKEDLVDVQLYVYEREVK